LPDHGLVAALEDERNHRGLIGIGPGFLDALVEVQTTGRVEAASLPPRPVTRIDEALCREFLDLLLAALTRELGDLDGRNWPDRMAYGSKIEDRARINLLLPEGAYTVFHATVGFEGTERRCGLAVVLPVVPDLRRSGGAAEQDGTEPDAAWITARRAALSAIPVPVEAVLLRLTRPLAALEVLSPGDLLPFDRTDLQQVSVLGAADHPLFVARLGQIAGKRAVRLPVAEDVAKDMQGEAPLSTSTPALPGSVELPSSHGAQGLDAGAASPAQQTQPDTEELAPLPDLPSVNAAG